MIMKCRSVHTVVAFAATTAAIARDIQINIASAETYKMEKRREKRAQSYAVREKIK